VNNHPIVTIDGARLEAEALRILRELPGVAVVEKEPRGPDRGADAVLHFAGTRASVAVEFKHRANAATAWQFVHYAAAHPDMAAVLIAGESTAEARDILARNGIGVIDGLGNAHLELPGLLLHLEGRHRPRGDATAAPARLSGKAGVAAQALLLAPKREWHVQDLAEEAGIAKGLAHRVLVRLEREGLMVIEGSGPRRVRRLTNPTALLDLWAEENVDRLRRTAAYALAQTPQQLVRDLGRGLDARGITHAVTGAAAASLVAPFVTAVPIVQLWVAARAAPADVCDAAGAELVSDGENVVLLQAKDDTPLAFRERAGDTWIVNRFRLYVDLRGDPRRGREQAEHLREEAIGF
jgi:Transcriptional regulator, AbiEi antitoxin, Type IV TA system